jgi:hypothetical protein
MKSPIPDPGTVLASEYKPLEVISSTNAKYVYRYALPITTDAYGNKGVFYDGTPATVFPYDGGFFIKYSGTNPALAGSLDVVYNVVATTKYNGSTTPPIGSSTTPTNVSVVVTMTSPAVNTFSFSYVLQPQAVLLRTIEKKSAYVEVKYNGVSQPQSDNFTSNLDQPISISYKGINATTYGPSSTPPTNAGTYLVTASITGTSAYSSASVTSYLTIKQLANVEVFNQNSYSAYYTASPIPVTFSTIPAGLSYTVKYTGSLTPPTNIGSYTIVGQISDSNVSPNALGTVISGEFSITKSNQIPSSTANSTTIVRATYSYAINKFLVDFVGTYQ